MIDIGNLLEQLKYWLQATVSFSNISSFLNSAFVVAAIGSCAGAVGGAFAAQRVIERNKRRDDFTKEIRSVNLAISLAFDVSQAVLSLKKQQLVELLRDYDAARDQALKIYRKARANEVHPGVFAFRAVLHTLPLRRVPAESLRKVAYEGISITGRALSLVTMALQSATDLDDSIERRNRLIQAFQVRFPTGGNGEFAALYFGLPSNDGDLNSEYPDVMKAIGTYTDDSIFFASLLCKDLHDHGITLAKKYKDLFGGPLARIQEVDFSKARSEGLMPSEGEYADYLQSFRKAPNEPTRNA